MIAGRGTYLVVLAFILVGSGWLEFVLRTRVLTRWRRLLLAVLPMIVIFMVWDAYAVATEHWTFDPDQTTGISTVAGIPLEELLFFVCVPLAAVLTLEAVRSVRRWEVGDELPGECRDGVRNETGDAR